MCDCDNCEALKSVQRRLVVTLEVVCDCRDIMDRDIPTEAPDIRLVDYIQSKLDKTKKLESKIKHLRNLISNL